MPSQRLDRGHVCRVVAALCSVDAAIGHHGIAEGGGCGVGCHGASVPDSLGAVSTSVHP